MNEYVTSIDYAADVSALLLLGFSVWIAVGLLAAWLATQRGRSGWAWFVVAMVLGPLALVGLLVVPSLMPPATDQDSPSPTLDEVPVPPQRPNRSDG